MFYVNQKIAAFTLFVVGIFWLISFLNNLTVQHAWYEWIIVIAFIGIGSFGIYVTKNHIVDYYDEQNLREKIQEIERRKNLK